MQFRTFQGDHANTGSEDRLCAGDLQHELGYGEQALHTSSAEPSLVDKLIPTFRDYAANEDFVTTNYSNVHRAAVDEPNMSGVQIAEESYRTASPEDSDEDVGAQQ